MITEEGESLLDALNAGMPSGDEPEAEVEQEEEVPEGEEAAEGDKPEGDEPEGDEDAEGAEGAEGEEGEEGDEAAAAAAAAKAAAKKPVDPINDPLPKGTLQQTSERFKFVVGKLKEETTRADTAQTNYDELIGEIGGAGMTGDTYAVMLEYARGVNGGTYEGLKKSHAILMQELTAVAKALGEPLLGQNPLEGHADLVKEVDEKKITPERAIEIARQRNRDAAQTALNARQQTGQRTAAQQQQAVNAGKTAMTALGKELAAKDGIPEYKRKAGIAVAMLKDVMGDLPPNKWVKTFRAAYAQIPSAPKAAPKPGAKPGQRPQPLRGNKVPSGQSSKQPKTLAEAMAPAFEQ